MIPASTLTSFAMLIFGVCAFIVIMLLPALLELKKPRDAGPRVIMEGIAIPGFQTRLALLEKTEEKIQLDHSVMKKMVDIISVLPNLES